ncbi:MAG: adenosine deaminase [Clostridia bacterium]|nr:adenosine deaminase [Clostridia bacterium]
MSRYSFPKIDLHLHLDGSVLPETAWELALERGVPMPADNLEDFRSFIIVTADCRSVNEYLKRFEMPLSILQDAPALIRVSRELVELLHSQGLAYAEIRFAPQLHTRKELTQKDAIEAVIQGVSEGLAACPGMQAGILLCTMCVGPSQVNEKANLETVELAAEYLGKGVVGVDLAGAEGIVPLTEFAPIFDLAREKKIPFTCHAGDSQGPETVKAALDFGTKRVGHGHHIFDDRDLCARAIRDGVTLEICPTSNIQCETQPSYEEHPLKKLMDMGMLCTINTDNMILSDINLDKEYDRCLNQMGLTYEDLIRCNINSVKACFLDEDSKQKLIRRLMDCLENR